MHRKKPAEGKNRQTVISSNLVSTQPFSLSYIFSVTSPNHKDFEVLRSLFFQALKLLSF